MNDKALSNAELELTQKVQMHFPRGVISEEMLKQWNGCKKEVLEARMAEFFSKPPEEIISETYLRRIYEGETLMLDAVDGSEILADAKDVFGWIDSDFISCGANEKGQATAETLVDVYEMIRGGTFANLFGSLNAKLDKLCFIQHQIKNFVVKHRSQLRIGGYGTFFLFKSKGKFFVASVRFSSDGELRVSVDRLGVGCVWHAENRLRFVVPQVA